MLGIVVSDSGNWGLFVFWTCHLCVIILFRFFPCLYKITPVGLLSSSQPRRPPCWASPLAFSLIGLNTMICCHLLVEGPNSRDFDVSNICCWHHDTDFLNNGVSGYIYISYIWNNFTAKTQYQKLETKIPRKGIVRPQSQFPHSWICERFIYSHNRSGYSAAGKYVDQSWEYIKRSQTHECGNWDWDRAIPFLEIHKWDFCCSVFTCAGQIQWPGPPPLGWRDPAVLTWMCQTFATTLNLGAFYPT